METKKDIMLLYIYDDGSIEEYSYMNKEDLVKIKKQIIEEVKKTKILIENYKNLTKPIAPENSIGRVSRMDAINNKVFIEEVLRKTEKN